jgi:hypothetical protein
MLATIRTPNDRHDGQTWTVLDLGDEGAKSGVGSAHDPFFIIAFAHLRHALHASSTICRHAASTAARSPVVAPSAIGGGQRRSRHSRLPS